MAIKAILKFRWSILITILLAGITTGCRLNNRSAIVSLDNITAKFLDINPMEYKNAVIKKDDSTTYIEITETGAGYFRLTNNIELFLLPGDRISIKSDRSRYEVGGDYSAYLSNCLRDITEKKKEILAGINLREYISSSSTDNLHQSMKIIEALDKALEEVEVNKQSAGFLKFEKARNRYRVFRLLNNYDINYAETTGFAAETDEDFYNYLDKVDYHNKDLLQLKEYDDFLKSLIDLQRRKTGTLGTEQTNILLDFFMGLDACQEVRDLLLKNIFFDQLYLLSVSEEQLAKFNESCKNDEFLHVINTRYETYKRIYSGMPAPDLKLIDPEGKIRLLSEFKGSYVYIDVWGLFCTPCIKAIPKFNEVKQILRNENIIFIGLCRELPQNSGFWIEKMKKLNVTGLQFLPENEKQFLSDFLVAEIPRYILIDPEGRYINANAPEPSDYLTGYLKEIINGNYSYPN